ncbi:hypothetical protein FB566_1124 [Stackebrandtia endophytica]|uniref:Uncharacterized protein n=1 Tax=Stackebrandtia endophytica TaxID=1496996 RepID=A0A543ASY7_9ACTN|nr:hypothetical protein [Stackebrandtia endophytica]TQL75615.1 hypothetical protein FB566_1124 [Stackebrandtia endophytica]
MLEPWQIPLITVAVIAVVVFAMRMRRRSAPHQPAESLDDVMSTLVDKTSELRERVRQLAAEGKRTKAIEAARPLAAMEDTTPEKIVDQIEAGRERPSGQVDLP